MTRCPEFRARLHDLIDASAETRPDALLARHLAACPDCSVALEDLRRLRREATDLRRDAAPARDLWPTIAARLGDQESVAPDSVERSPGDPDAVTRRSRRPHPAYLAAAAALACALLLPALRGNVLSTSQELADLDRTYEEVRRDGEELLREDGLSPRAAADLRDGMGAIDSAVAETRRAWRQATDAPERLRSLTTGYRKKIDLLRGVVRRAARPLGT